LLWLNAGLLLIRELDEHLGLSQLISDNPTDARHGKNTQLPPPDHLLHQSIYSRLAGYEDLNDAERLSQDPIFRLIGSERIWDRGAALPSRMHWFKDWSLTSLQQRLIKTGGRLVKHARYYWLLLAEGLLTRGRFASMLRRITLLPLPAS
jgi:hypothetical protein